MKGPFIRSAYNYDTVAASDEASAVLSGPSLTDQSMAEDADINVIMRRYGITGRMPDPVRLPMYGDYASVTSYSEALAAVMRAEDEFMAIPAEIRSRFDNNPQKYLDFVVDPANVDTLRSWGMLKDNSHGSGTSVRASNSPAGGEVRAAGVGGSGDSGAAGSGASGVAVAAGAGGR